MVPKDENVASSETGTVPWGEEKARIEIDLDRTESHLTGAESAAVTRRLKLAVQVCRWALASWETRSPSREEIGILRERVNELLRVARRYAPTVRPPRLR
jgi:hypothetical protein